MPAYTTPSRGFDASRSVACRTSAPRGAPARRRARRQHGAGLPGRRTGASSTVWQPLCRPDGATGRQRAALRHPVPGCQRIALATPGSAGSPSWCTPTTADRVDRTLPGRYRRAAATSSTSTIFPTRACSTAPPSTPRPAAHWWSPEGVSSTATCRFINGRITRSDIITTRQPDLRAEIASQAWVRPPRPAGHRADRLYGILNGIDYDLWNPQTDTPRFRSTSAQQFTTRPNKTRLQQVFRPRGTERRRPVRARRRLVEQKGIDLILAVLHTTRRSPTLSSRSWAAATPCWRS